VRRLAIAGLAATEAWLAAGTAYLLGLVALAARDGSAAPRPSGGQPLSIAVLVPAHDEAAAIGETVAALLAQDYPAARREAIVVADNCTDDTASVARAAGATVWERTDPAQRGKGQALAWALERLWRERPGVDAVAIVDADCRASANLLAAFDAHLRAGAQAVQAVYDVANPDASPSSALRWAGFALMHRVRPRGRRALGLSADLFGTGMAFSAQLLRAHPWRSFSVTEDAEYHLQLLEAGVPVAFAEDAAVESPMPTSESDARAQQLRWESGNSALARRTVPRLALRGIRERDPQLLHAALEQLVPPQTALLALNGAATAASGLLRRRRLLALGVLTGAGQAAYVLLGLRVAGAPPAVYRALRAAPRLVLAKLPLFARIGVGRGAREWVRTPRA
jgi:cellulose synthase/poly-beta-1,6-N-acetylglucosamine synthase-like glycosyltransferase